ncbi:hypothetical protein HNP46_006764 [Pseudomonas nitritireducens]|uniref:Uncharacterized protein n=1 Tax=Pseudomonas nitroreducens TaxID=46680 RepID=A0A7W7P5L9_PSENT|nr:hypothetical protein [Pseudomonas nitritireducens]MBB4867845.1 hypothetical protein [Pseudomonas nitritireducens]
MRAYLILWPIFMFAIVGPAFNFAAIATFVSWIELKYIIQDFYHVLWVPNFLADLLAFLACIVAKLIPSCLTVIVAVFAAFLPGGFGIVLFSFILAFIPAPFAEKIRQKLDARDQAKAAQADKATPA